MTEQLKNIVEALLMVAESPLTMAKIRGLFDEDDAPPIDEIKQAIQSLQEDCESRGIELVKIGGGYRYQSKLQYAQWIRKFQAEKPPRFSRAQLETLAIIAYRQPVTRGDIEQIRGVSVSQDIMQRLLEREWIKQVGVRDVPGRPALFGTTIQFLSYFNLKALSDLPDLIEQRTLDEVAQDMDIGLSAEALAILSETQKPQTENTLKLDDITEVDNSRDDNDDADTITVDSQTAVTSD